ncbi:MAG: hypothetical protein JSR44_09515 [Spirochaetes bacterium]|nr:hypothetical protein [Spirochaetota bacterium]
MRKAITNFSKASGRRFRYAYETRPEDFKDFVSLTFPRQFFVGLDIDSARQKLKEFIRDYLQTVRKLSGIYLWVVEEQSDGTPHLHILTSGNGEAFAHIWRRLMIDRLFGECPKGFFQYGARVDVVKDDVLQGYMAKTCGYMLKSGGEDAGSLMFGWRRWGRNYASIPWSVEGASGEDLNFAPFAASLGRRKGFLISQLICETGVLFGVPLDVDEPIAETMRSQYECSLASGGRLYPF